MKRFKNIILSSTIFMAATISQTAQAKLPDAVYMDSGIGTEQCISILGTTIDRFATQALRGEELPLYDAETSDRIANLEVPDNRLFNKPAKKRVLRENLQQRRLVKAFCEHSKIDDKSTLIPDALRTIGKNAPKIKDGIIYDVLVVGYSRVIDPRSPSTAMTGGLVPGDGHYRAFGPYGMQSEQALLDGVRVHFLAPDDNWIMTPAHETEVERSIAVQVQGRDGELASYERDTDTIFERIDTGKQNRIQYRPASQTDYKLIMVDYSAPPFVGENIFDRELSTERLSEAELSQPLDNVSVGIAWECNCDNDLLAMRNKISPPLYWNNTYTLDGRFLKDYRSPNARRGFETVEFSRPVKLSELLLAVNLYGGENITATRGKIRIAVGNRTYEAPFSISASQGNKGAGLNGIIETRTSPNEAWIMIDPVSVVQGSE